MIHSMLVRLLLFTRLPAKQPQQPRKAKEELHPPPPQPKQPQEEPSAAAPSAAAPRQVKQERQPRLAMAVEPPSTPLCMSMNVYVLHDQQSLTERCF